MSHTSIFFIYFLLEHIPIKGESGKRVDGSGGRGTAPHLLFYTFYVYTINITVILLLIVVVRVGELELKHALYNDY